MLWFCSKTASALPSCCTHSAPQNVVTVQFSLKIDAALRDGLSRILTVDLSDDNWLQASLPVKNGGLGIRSVTTLAPSAFLSSAASTLTLQDAMLAQFSNTSPDPAVTRSNLARSAMANDVEPVSERRHIQKAWDGVVTLKQQNSLLLKATSSIDQVRLLLQYQLT